MAVQMLLASAMLIFGIATGTTAGGNMAKYKFGVCDLLAWSNSICIVGASFCIAVMGHQGWSHDPDSTARYALVATIEILGQEIPIYERLRTAVIELQNQLEVENQPEVELDDVE